MRWTRKMLRVATGTVFVAVSAMVASSARAAIEDAPIPRSELVEKCGLDPDIMAGVDRYFLQGRPFVVYRNGHYCWRSGGATAVLHAVPVEMFSSTKTFGAILVGAVAARSSLRDTSRLTDWLTPAELAQYAPRVNHDATVAHVLAMTASSGNLAHGQKDRWSYDATGIREINILIPLMSRVIEREPTGFDGATDIQEFAAALLRKLGMKQTFWPGFSIGYSLQSTSADLARMGELVLRKGMWNGERILDERYVYRMTHPAFSDANTGYGYLMWVNAATNNIGATRNSTCAPYARWQTYPHAPFFDDASANGGYPFADPAEDIGLAWADGMLNSTFVVHRGLDLVLGSSLSPLETIPRFIDPEVTNENWLWNNVRPALLATLPAFANDEAAFCTAYRAGMWSQTRSPWSVEASL